MIDFGTASLENPIEDGSGVGLSRHSRNFVC
jgi:hypothetical protein